MCSQTHPGQLHRIYLTFIVMCSPAIICYLNLRLQARMVSKTRVICSVIRLLPQCQWNDDRIKAARIEDRRRIEEYVHPLIFLLSSPYLLRAPQSIEVRVVVT